MNQMTLTDMEYSNRKKKTKREKFLDAMDEIIPWSYWVEMIRPYYFNNKRGRKPIGIETMLRMYLMQVWFNLSDEGIEDSIYDSYAMRTFMHIDFNEQQVPDATTLLKFRHILEKNKNGERDPEMHQTKKGNEWYFGMKVHAGADAGSGYVHSLTGTSANMHDVSETSKLIRKDDHVVYGDSGYLGAPMRDEIKNDEVLSKIEFRINKRPSSLKTADDFEGINWDKKMEHDKSAVRCKVEHAFLIVKKQMGYAKVVYRGIEKNMNRFHMLFASANLIMCSRAGRTQDFLECME